MTYFQCDYAKTAHPRILARLSELGQKGFVGYGEDEICQSAAQKIKAACKAPNADVHFLVGGTQTNAVVICSILKTHQGALCADSGHIAVHETGAIEATGHKVLTLPSNEGKITAAQVEKFCAEYDADPVQCHTVEPGLVYISVPTETGTMYSHSELVAIYEVCKRREMPLFIDGARLGYGLASKGCDLNLSDIAALCDVFYIGGTKCGAMFGEAVVIVNDKLKKSFRHIMKQRGGLLAKGWLLGLQFDELFMENLYFDICKNAVKYATAIKEAFARKGVPSMGASTTNQQFFALTDTQLQKLSEKYVLEFFHKMDDGRNFVRVCTSWATTEEEMEALISDIAAL